MSEMKNSNDILNRIKNNYNDKEYEIINKCYLYAQSIFKDQMINDFESQIDHALQVIDILLDLNVDYITIAATFFHEIVNDANGDIEEIRDMFGDEIAKITESINAINNLSLTINDEDSVIYLRKVLVGLASDPRVIFIKLADRLHNMRHNWKVIDDAKKVKIKETEKVLIPIAHRLGINGIKSELEDLCLLYNNPSEYHEIEANLEANRDELKEILINMQNSLSDLLDEANIKHEIKSRVKSIHSIHDKIHNKGKSWNDIYDILALRIFVNSTNECYSVLGLIHANYRPVPNRFKDYIANPKENMYQSLHTTVFGEKGRFFEIQIRTYEMDEIAEKGIASHWSYKEHGTIKAQNYMEQKLEIFRDLIENNMDSDETDNDENYINEILNENIYVFTPKGDVVELPYGSTPIDFAYRIHSKIGDTMIGAIVNDEIVPIDYKLENNDIVSIKTNASSTPSADWLNIVKSTQARNKIKAYFNQKTKEEYIERGHDMLDKEAHKKGLNLNNVLSGDILERILKSLKLNEIDDIYLNVGSLRYTPNYILSFIDDNKNNQYDVLLNKISNYQNRKVINNCPVKVDGLDNVRITLAKCCNPIYGDDIVGFVTLNQGLTVHRRDCVNISDKERLVNVSWNQSENEFLVNLKIETLANKNYLIDLITIVSSNNLNVIKIDSTTNIESNIYYLTIKLKNNEELKHLIIQLENKPYVIKVSRGL